MICNFGVIPYCEEMPENGAYMRHIAQKMLAIHKVFLRFFAYLTHIATLFRCKAVFLRVLSL